MKEDKPGKKFLTDMCKNHRRDVYEKGEQAMRALHENPKNRKRRVPRRRFGIGVAVFVICLVLWSGVASAMDVGEVVIGKASWYSTECCRYNPHNDCPTASGRSLYDLERDGVMFAAMWDVPLGSVVRVSTVDGGKWIDVVVLDRGPARRLNRKIDLCKAAFKKISNLKNGICTVKLEVLR